MSYRSIIIEDERFLAEQLQDLVLFNCPEIEIAGMAYSADTAVQLITELKPDLVFMDIEMPGMNAFELLEKVTYKNFDIVFTTAYGHYALQAFDQNVVHYLLKPITEEGLKRAVQKYIQKTQKQGMPNITEMLNAMNGFGHLDKKIRLPVMNGFTMVAVKEIIRMEAEGRYTKIFIKENKPTVNSRNTELISRNIREFEKQLNGYNFFRCHHSHLVNLKSVKSYTRGEGGILVMENGESIPVSKNKKEELLKRLNDM